MGPKSLKGKMPAPGVLHRFHMVLCHHFPGERWQNRMDSLSLSLQQSSWDTWKEWECLQTGFRFLSCGEGGRKWVSQRAGSVLTSLTTFSCPQLPRQALSLLFDTYHNEVDAFLLAEVSMSTDPGAGPASQSSFLPLPQSSWDQPALEGVWSGY